MAQTKSGAVRNPNWSREELLVALDFYLRQCGSIPSKDSQAITDLQQRIFSAARRAQLTGDHRFRNRNGVYMKLMNFRRLDSRFKDRGSGLSRGGKLEELLWGELTGDAAECTRLAEKICSGGS